MGVRFAISALVITMQCADASELMVASPGGTIVAGEEAELEFILWGGQEHESQNPADYEVVGVNLEGVGPVAFDYDGGRGVWITSFRPMDAGNISLSVTTSNEEVVSSLVLVEEAYSERFDSVLDAGTSRGNGLEMNLSGDCGLARSFGSSEGLWSGSEGQLVWSSETNRHPRLALVGIASEDAQCREVVWTPVRLAASVPVTVSTEPGTTMTVVIGGRTYGPVVADDGGTASVNIRVRPGELSATASLMDPLGNSQETTIPTGGQPIPALAILATGELRVGDAPPELHIAAVSGRGSPYSGRAIPRCLGGNGYELPLRELSRGIWRASLPESAYEGGFDFRVDCQLESVHATHRIPVVRGEPNRIRLRVYPTELSTDFPVAEIEASMLDAYGDRIEATGLYLDTNHGEIEVDSRSEVLRGDFVGDVSFQDDLILAGWIMPEVQGPVVDLKLGAQATDVGQEVVVRALSSSTSVLAGASIILSIGDQTREVVTDARGWAASTFDGVTAPYILRASGGDIFSERIIPRSSDTWLDSSAPDLMAETELFIRDGSIRTIGVSATPSVLYGGSSQSAQIEIRLLDRAGNLLHGKELELSASSGEIEVLGQSESGEYVARFEPDINMLLGEVDITAAAEGFSTTFGVRVIPRPQTHTLAAGIGWMYGVDASAGRTLSLDYDRRLELLGGAVLARASYLNWVVTSQLYDSVRERDLDVAMEVHALSAQMMLFRENDLVSTWLGVGITSAPYLQRLAFEGEVPISAWGVSQLGTMGTAGVGRRLYGGQLFGEARWVGLRDGGGSVGYGGLIGGVAALAGFRLIL